MAVEKVLVLIHVTLVVRQDAKAPAKALVKAIAEAIVLFLANF